MTQETIAAIQGSPAIFRNSGVLPLLRKAARTQYFFTPTTCVCVICSLFCYVLYNTTYRAVFRVHAKYYSIVVAVLELYLLCLLSLSLFVLQTARTRTLRCSVRNHDLHGTVLYCTVLLYSTTPPLRSILALRYSSTAMHNRATKRTEIANTHSRNTHKKEQALLLLCFTEVLMIQETSSCLPAGLVLPRRLRETASLPCEENALPRYFQRIV